MARTNRKPWAQLTREEQAAECEASIDQRTGEHSAERRELIEKLRAEARKTGVMNGLLLEQAAQALTEGDAALRRVVELDRVILFATHELNKSPGRD